MSDPEDGEEGYKTLSSGCGRAVPLTDAQQLWLPVRELHGVKPTRSGSTAPSSPDWAQWATEKREDLKWGGGCVLVLEGSVGGGSWDEYKQDTLVAGRKLSKNKWKDILFK